jgi:hypothetical protein
MQLIKTALGQAAFKERSPLFSARQRSMFILFDGNKTVDQVLAATAGMGSNQADIDHMLFQGFLALVAPVAAPLASADAALAPEAVVPHVVSNRTVQERYLEAKPLATQMTASLGLRGFRLNLSVESAAGYDELLALLPKIQDAVGTKASKDLERALKG